MEENTNVSASLHFQNGTTGEIRDPPHSRLSADAYVNQLQNRVRL